MSIQAPNASITVLLEDNPSDARLVQEMLRHTSPDTFDVTWVERLSEAVALQELVTQKNFVEADADNVLDGRRRGDCLC